MCLCTCFIYIIVSDSSVLFGYYIGTVTDYCKLYTRNSMHGEVKSNYALDLLGQEKMSLKDLPQISFPQL